MALHSTPLPSDPALLTELALALEAENETLRTTIVTLKALIFGARSERFAGLGSEQLALDLLDSHAEETRKTAAGNDDVPPGEPARKAPRKRPSATSGSCPNIFPAANA
jgi:transposase